ncbi:MAG: cytidylate kinase [Pseudomonadota bacterium]
MTPVVPVLAVDGPSGSGKGTVCRLVAGRLGWHLLDSGALYRIVALGGRRNGLPTDDVEGHAVLARQLDVRFGSRPDGSEQVLFGPHGEDITAGIRTEEAGMGASRVAAWPQVREALLQRQRDFARPPGLVADGRDMGTVVFPGAGLKIFLTASAEERARRRHNQLKEKGYEGSLADLSREIAERDARDASRPVSPLKAADDAIVVDSTPMGITAVVDHVLALALSRGLAPRS